MGDDPRHGYRDRDHRVEAAFGDYVEDHTPQNALAAGLAVAKLQRAYDHVLRRLDGDGELPEFPVHAHNPALEDPEQCATHCLDELAGAQLVDRAETLAHGLEAVNALGRRYDVVLADWADAQQRAEMLELESQRLMEQIGRLRRDLSEARSWVWAELHGSWNDDWFPLSWRPQHPQDERRPPDWLADARPPHRQDWWAPRGVVIRMDLSDFIGVNQGAVPQSSAPEIETGDVVCPTDGTRWVSVEVTGIEGGWALVEVRWHSDEP